MDSASSLDEGAPQARATLRATSESTAGPIGPVDSAMALRISFSSSRTLSGQRQASSDASASGVAFAGARPATGVRYAGWLGGIKADDLTDRRRGWSVYVCLARGIPPGGFWVNRPAGENPTPPEEPAMRGQVASLSRGLAVSRSRCLADHSGRRARPSKPRAAGNSLQPGVQSVGRSGVRGGRDIVAPSSNIE